VKRLANFTADSILGSDRLPSLSAQPLGHEFGHWECDIFFQNYPADGELIRKKYLLCLSAILSLLNFINPLDLNFSSNNTRRSTVVDS